MPDEIVIPTEKEKEEIEKEVEKELEDRHELNNDTEDDNITTILDDMEEGIKEWLENLTSLKSKLKQNPKMTYSPETSEQIKKVEKLPEVINIPIPEVKPKSQAQAQEKENPKKKFLDWIF